MDEDNAGNSKEQVRSFVNDRDKVKPNERKKRKHLSTWVGTFKARDKTIQVSANYKSDLINKVTDRSRLIEL